jgi:hypothetical protein
MLDMKRIVDTIRRARPDVNFSLEMITRDPLEVPCLTDKYRATFGDVNGVHLARLLARVRAHLPASPLPHISGLSPSRAHSVHGSSDHSVLGGASLCRESRPALLAGRRASAGGTI